MTFGYNVALNPGSAFRRLRLFISGQNLFTITGYTGVDPEVRYTDPGAVDNGGGFGINFDDDPDPLSPGIERRDTYFTTRILTFGLNLGF
jgi:iron complex outermembrane receptor protein